MVKLTFEMSKKTFPTQETRMRAWVVGVVGIVKVSEPSLAVEPVRDVEKLLPPSVDRSIATLAQEMGATLVPATFQVTVCALLPVQLTAVLGWVTTNGPAVAFTVTVVEAQLTPPPPVRLSRAVR